MVKNLSSGKIISKDAKHPRDYIDRVFGMILSRNSGGIILKTRFGIHTLFLKKPIDVIIVDSSRRVVKMQKGLAPFNIFVWNPVFNTVIETSEGSIVKSKTKIGDTLDF